MAGLSDTAHEALNIGLAIVLLISTILFLLPPTTIQRDMSAKFQTSRISYYMRSTTAAVALFICAFYGTVASAILRLFGQHRYGQYTTAHAFRILMDLFCNVRFKVISGSEHVLTRPGPTVIVCNHQSALDVLLLAAVWPYKCSVTAKASLRWVPILGWYMALSGTIFINRGDRARATKALAGAAREMRAADQSVFIFPEGTRTNSVKPDLGPFKKGAFHLAIEAQVPILPVVAASYHGLLSLREKRFRSGVVPMAVLAPIPTKGLTVADVDSLVLQVRQAMLAALVELAATEMGRDAMTAQPERKARGVLASSSH